MQNPLVWARPVAGMLAEHRVQRIDEIGRRRIGGKRPDRAPDHDQSCCAEHP
jgi:hypothetical protein